MSNLYIINVTNKTNTIKQFFFFQEPAKYIGGLTTYTNSILSTELQPSSQGATFQFKLLQEYYAGVQTQADQLVVGEASGTTSATQLIELTSEENLKSKNYTEMNIPLGLTSPKHEEEVQKGAFRIRTPKFNPESSEGKFNAGLAVKDQSSGSIVLNNFVTADPQTNIDVQPVLIFYVQTGSYQAGSVVNFSISSSGAAKCDATQGVTKFDVEYMLDGSWKVNGKVQQGLTQLL